MKKILLMGSQGSIGRRYSAILKRIGQDACLYDIKSQRRLIDISDFDHIIIATPTETHVDILISITDFCHKYSCPIPAILCEKPVSTGVLNVIDLIPDFSMVFQYGTFFDKKEYDNLEWSQGDYVSSYSYYDTGKDGIFWDLIQVIGLHKGNIDSLYVSTDSIVWDCTVNNKRLCMQEMQLSYLKMIQDWLSGERLLTKEQIKRIHQKVYEYKNYHCNSSEIHVN